MADDVTGGADGAVIPGMREPRTDGSLVRAARRGDTQAFAALVHRYRDRHVRFAIRMLGSRDDAEDVLQSVFLRAYRNVGACEDPERFGAWLHRIVVNECRTFATRRGARELRLVRDEAVLAATIEPTAESDPALRAEIQRALARLPEDLREAFLLKHVEDLSYDEMAEATGAGISALKMRVKRACEQLREQLEGVVHD
jgi:RNA polymerase sigma-70 factor (ECF subfamily)